MSPTNTLYGSTSSSSWPTSVRALTRARSAAKFQARPASFTSRRAAAARSAWSVKAAQNELTVIDSINFGAPRTKDFVAFAKAVKADGKKLLLVVGQDNRNVYLSARNIPNTEVMRAADVNTYALLNASAVVMTEEALNVINNL